VRAVGASVDDREYETIHGAWWGTVIPAGAREIVRRSVERYGRARGALTARRAAPASDYLPLLAALPAAIRRRSIAWS